MTQRFTVEDLKATITSANFRKEKHGETRILAFDLGVETKVDAKQFDAIVQQLIPDQGLTTNLRLLLDSGELPKPIALLAEFEKHRVSFRQSTITLAILPDAKVNEFRLELDGNVYALRFRIQSLKGSADANLITDSIQNDVVLTISPAQGELDLEDEEDGDE